MGLESSTLSKAPIIFASVRLETHSFCSGLPWFLTLPDSCCGWWTGTIVPPSGGGVQKLKLMLTTGRIRDRFERHGNNFNKTCFCQKSFQLNSLDNLMLQAGGFISTLFGTLAPTWVLSQLCFCGFGSDLNTWDKKQS